MSNRFFLQNSTRNSFATVNGFPTPGATIVSQPYNGGPAQQWIPAQYPGKDLNDTTGVVCVLYTANDPSLVMTAGQCKSANTLQKFQPYNHYQLWAYTPGGSSRFLNLATGCSLDLDGGTISGGKLQTWPTESDNQNQVWTLRADLDARALAQEFVSESEAAAV